MVSYSVSVEDLISLLLLYIFFPLSFVGTDVGYELVELNKKL